MELVEDLGSKEEVTTVLPMTQIPHRRDARDHAVIGNVHCVMRGLRGNGQQAGYGVARREAVDHVGQGTSVRTSA